jgi:hypothetical protein
VAVQCGRGFAVIAWLVDLSPINRIDRSAQNSEWIEPAARVLCTSSAHRVGADFTGIPNGGVVLKPVLA